MVALIAMIVRVIIAIVLMLLLGTPVGAQGTCDAGFVLEYSGTIDHADGVASYPRSGYIVLTGDSYFYASPTFDDQVVVLSQTTTRLNLPAGSTVWYGVVGQGEVLDVARCAPPTPTEDPNVPTQTPTPYPHPTFHAPTPTAMRQAYPAPLTYGMTTTHEIAEQFVAFGDEGAAEQPIMLGFGGLVLGVFVMIFFRAIIGGRP
jgi:hypothetical protein